MAEVKQQVATEEGKIDRGVLTDVDLSGQLYTFMKGDTNNFLTKATAGDRANWGILQTAPNGSSKETYGQVRLQGISMLKLAGTVAKGNYIKSDANGNGVVTSGANDQYNAMALGAGVSGDYIPVLICHGFDVVGSG